MGQEIRHCQRCQATSKTTQSQCRRVTCKIADVCWQHLKSVYHLQVKRSRVPNAGLGLFTTHAIKVPKKGTKRILQYARESRFMPRETMAAINDRYGDGVGEYVWCKNKNNCFDCRSTQCSNARRANACDRPGHRLTCNAKINNKGCLVATKNIPAGGEIYVPYGRDYWLGQ